MRYKITIEYDGTSLLGWQEQLDGPSVQDYLQKALNCFTPLEETNDAPLSDEEYEDAGTGRRLQKTDKIIVSGAGRTDAGVHATAQVAHFDLKEDLVDWKLREAINARLREMEAPVSVIAVEKSEMISMPVSAPEDAVTSTGFLTAGLRPYWKKPGLVGSGAFGC